MRLLIPSAREWDAMTKLPLESSRSPRWAGYTRLAQL